MSGGAVLRKKQPYAYHTSVEVSRSMEEIRLFLLRVQAYNIKILHEDTGATVVCDIAVPNRKPETRYRLKFSISHRYDSQEQRRAWRCLLFILRARFEELFAEVSVFEEAFLPNIVVDTSGHTVYDCVANFNTENWMKGAQQLALPPGRPR